MTVCAARRLSFFRAKELLMSIVRMTDLDLSG